MPIPGGIYDRARKRRLLWKRPVDGELAGPKAFALERRSVVVSDQFRVCLIDTDSGEAGLCHDASSWC